MTFAEVTSVIWVGFFPFWDSTFFKKCDFLFLFFERIDFFFLETKEQLLQLYI